MKAEHNYPMPDYDPIRQKGLCTKKVLKVKKMMNDNSIEHRMRMDILKVLLIVPVIGVSFVIAATYAAGSVQNLPWSYLIGSVILIATWGICFVPILKRLFRDTQ